MGELGGLLGLDVKITPDDFLWLTVFSFRFAVGSNMSGLIEK